MNDFGTEFLKISPQGVVLPKNAKFSPKFSTSSNFRTP